MTTQQSVVTTERFATGRTWEEYMAFIGAAENLQRPRPGGSTDRRPDNTATFKKNDGAYTMTLAHQTAVQALPKRRG